MSQPKFAEEGKGTVKFSRANRWKARDAQLNSNAPGPGHYAKPEDNSLRGPVYAFSSCPRETDPTRISSQDREWKEKLGPGSYDIALEFHAVCTKITNQPRNIELCATENLGPHMGPGKYEIVQDYHTPCIHLPGNEVISHPIRWKRSPLQRLLRSKT